MSKFFVSPDHITKALDDDHTITFRKLGYGERQKLISACSKIDPFTQEAAIDFAALSLAVFKARIVGWAGPEFEGFDCTPDNVELLEQEAAQQMLQAMGEANEELTEDEKKG